MTRSTDCVRCDGTGIMSKAPEGGVKCWYCKGNGKRAWLLTQNAELRPMGIYNWTLPAFVVQLSNGKHFNVCPHAGICASVCYALNGTYKFPSVRQAHVNKLEMTLQDRNGWLHVMGAELSHPRYKGKWVRIHDGGDFYDESYLEAWLYLARQHPETTFYCYTKEVAMFRKVVEHGTVVVKDGDQFVAVDPNTGAGALRDHPEDARRVLLGDRLPANFLYIYSMGGKQDHLLDKDVDRHAEIFKDFDVMRAAGYDDQEEDDRMCVTNRNIRVGIVENNIPAFKKIMAGRTFGEMQEERDAKKRSKLERLASDPATGERPDPVDEPAAVSAYAADDALVVAGEPRTPYIVRNHKPDLPVVADDQGTLF